MRRSTALRGCITKVRDFIIGFNPVIINGIIEKS